MRLIQGHNTRVLVDADGVVHRTCCVGRAVGIAHASNDAAAHRVLIQEHFVARGHVHQSAV